MIRAVTYLLLLFTTLRARKKPNRNESRDDVMEKSVHGNKNLVAFLEA